MHYRKVKADAVGRPAEHTDTEEELTTSNPNMQILDFRNIQCCSGPCIDRDPMPAEGTREHEILYPGVSISLVVRNGLQCKPCYKRFLEFCEEWDNAEHGMRERFQNDARAIINKFTAMTTGGVHAVCDEFKESV